jgi:hypothetical protein
MPFDALPFDDLLRSLAATPSRRGLTHALAGLALAGPLGALLGLPDAEAKKRHKRKKKKCKKSKRRCGKHCIPATSCCDDRGCDPDERCQSGACVCAVACCSDAACGTGNLCVNGQCITGQGTCPTGGDVCQGTGGGGDCGAAGVACTCVTTTTGEARCASNTGLGSICGDCSDDSICVSDFGPGAFCARGSAFECCSGIDGLCVAPCPA